jgi:hypothetical protein
MSGVHGAMGSPEADAEHIREAQTTVKMVLILDGAAPSAAPLISGNIVLAFGSPNAVPDSGSTVTPFGLYPARY